MIVIGIDLSGPSNIKDTVVVAFRVSANGMRRLDALDGASDRAICDLASRYAQRESVVIGVDAPLSYNPGGGLRSSDRDLQKLVIAKGMPSGTVMPPTLNRMAYLTLRGVTVARMLESVRKVSVVEVHPGAVMALRGASVEDVRMFRHVADSRAVLLDWLEQQGLKGVRKEQKPSDHYVAACACALAAWRWSACEAIWLTRSSPPDHPYDFAC